LRGVARELAAELLGVVAEPLRALLVLGLAPAQALERALIVGRHDLIRPR